MGLANGISSKWHYTNKLTFFVRTLLVANKEIKPINNVNNYGSHQQTRQTNHPLTRNSIRWFSKQHVHNQWVWFSNSKHQESSENLLIELQKWNKDSLIECCFVDKWYNYISSRAKPLVVKTMCHVLLGASSPTILMFLKINLQFCLLLITNFQTYEIVIRRKDMMAFWPSW